jgi:subtilisin family serine protease
MSARGVHHVEIAAPANKFNALTLDPAGFGSREGNSLATPLVTGTVGLMVAADPSLNGKPSLIKDRILCNATKNAGLKTLVEDGNTLNAFAAVTNQKNCP